MRKICYEVSKEEIDVEDRLTAFWGEDYAEGLGFAYCEDMDDAARKEALDAFTGHFPEGMFTRVSDNRYRYNGGFAKWEKEYSELLRQIAASLPSNQLLASEEFQRLLQTVQHPLRGVLFYVTDETESTYMDDLTAMRFLIGTLQEGDLLSIGGAVYFVS